MVNSHIRVNLFCLPGQGNCLLILRKEKKKGGGGGGGGIENLCSFSSEQNYSLKGKMALFTSTSQRKGQDFF